MLTEQVKSLLWHDLAMFLLFGALLGVLLGLLLIIKPQFVERLNRVANRWISTRQMNRWLDRSVRIERWFYRHHRMTGLAIVLGAVYIFVFFGIHFDRAYTLQRLGVVLPVKLLDVLLDSLRLGLLAASAVAFILGLLICFRPSLLRDIEKKANQWVSTRRATKIFDVPRDQVDRFVERHAQRVGWLLLLGSIYLFLALFRSLA